MLRKFRLGTCEIRCRVCGLLATVPVHVDAECEEVRVYAATMYWHIGKDHRSAVSDETAHEFMERLPSDEELLIASRAWPEVLEITP